MLFGIFKRLNKTLRLLNVKLEINKRNLCRPISCIKKNPDLPANNLNKVCGLQICLGTGISYFEIYSIYNKVIFPENQRK
jgi:hypothetical protein